MSDYFQGPSLAAGATYQARPDAGVLRAQIANAIHAGFHDHLNRPGSVADCTAACWQRADAVMALLPDAVLPDAGNDVGEPCPTCGVEIDPDRS